MNEKSGRENMAVMEIGRYREVTVSGGSTLMLLFTSAPKHV